MRRADEKGAAAWLLRLLTTGRWDRLIGNRFFNGQVLSFRGQPGAYMVRIKRTTDQGWDGNEYGCYTPGYMPRVGDQVVGCWTDADVGMILFPTASTAAPQSVAPVKIGEVGPLSAAQPSASFPVIRQDLRHLRLKYSVRSTVIAAATEIDWQANGDTGTNYWDSFMYEAAAGGAPGGTFVNAVAHGNGPQISGASSPAGTFGDGSFDFFDYASKLHQKGAVATGGYTDTTNKSVMTRYSTWAGIAAITSLLFFPTVGLFDVGSVLTLYGEP